MGLDMAAAFRDSISRLQEQAGLRTVILTGAGPAFSAGGDYEMLREKRRLSPDVNRQAMLDFYNSFLCMLELPVPIIAAINGHAIGAGLCVALACDFRFAAKTAKLGLTFTRLGLHPGMAATLFLPRIVGSAIATSLLVTGRVLTGNEASQLGIVAAVEVDQVVKEAEEVAQSIMRGGPQAIAGLLATLRPSAAELQEALVREADQQSQNFNSDEYLEGLAAATEKRAPRF
jgi:enoyl-CoA hydratase/carnithine racemase